ncbi:MAG: sugar phosphate isomerase/epimerase [Planctomycetes bacterium]|nr:sugar phosphate isomerase/epimerase [Planctomycetota bacterium]
MKPISLQLYTLREMAKSDLLGMLRNVARIGYPGVELAGLYDQKPAAFRKMLDDLGLKVSSAHTGMVNKDNLSQQVDAAKALGYDILGLGYLPGEKFASVDQIKRTADELEAAATMLAPHGLKFAYHNHPHEFVLVDGKYVFTRLLECSKKLLAEVDTYWACNFGAVDVPAFIKQFASRIPLLHIKDGPLVKGQPHMAVGSGKMDFKKVLAAADDKVLKWLVVELDECATDMLTAVRESYNYLISSGLGKGR